MCSIALHPAANVSLGVHHGRTIVVATVLSRVRTGIQVGAVHSAEEQDNQDENGGDL